MVTPCLLSGRLVITPLLTALIHHRLSLQVVHVEADNTMAISAWAMGSADATPQSAEVLDVPPVPVQGHAVSHLASDTHAGLYNGADLRRLWPSAVPYS
jgi:hypothetical protein